MNDPHPVLSKHSKPSRLAAALFGMALLSCRSAQNREVHEVARGALDQPEMVARVAGSFISLESLNKAASQGSAPSRVLDELIETRVYGQFAETGGLEPGRLRTVRRAMLGRALLERLEERAKASGPPTDAEVESMTAERWVEFDRGEAMKTCHAVILAEKLTEQGGETLARRLADALRTYSDCREFLEHAKTFPLQGAKLSAEDLPPVLADGRTLLLNREGEPIEAGPRFELAFAQAVHQIKAPGEQSPVVRTRFGWHVILLASKIPEKRVSLAARREALSVDILRRRAKEASDTVLAQSRSAVGVAVDRSAIEAMGRVRVGQ